MEKKFKIVAYEPRQVDTVENLIITVYVIF